MPSNLTYEENQRLSSLESDIDYHNKKCLELFATIRNILDEKVLKAFLKEYATHTKEVHILTARRQMATDDLIKKYNIE